MPDAVPVLSARGLVTRFRSEAGDIHPSRDIDLDLARGEVLGLVGESGSGKSVTARALARLVVPESAVRGGTVLYKGRDLYRMTPDEVRALRGREIAMIVQDPAAALNPVMTIGEQITRVARTAPGGLDADAARAAAIALLARLRIAEPERRLAAYPHQMSGGMKQRVLIAMALIRRPSLLIADEPTTALDVTVAAEILRLLDELRRDLGMAMLLISHDLAMIARHCDRVAVMYAGRIVEQGPTADVLGRPRHPYTRALLGSVPKGTRADGLLPAIPGEPPDLARLPAGCAFAARCPNVEAPCSAPQPLIALGDGRASACWRARDTVPA